MSVRDVAVLVLPILVVIGKVNNVNVAVPPEVIADVMDFLRWRDVIFVYDESLSKVERHGMLAVFADHHVGVITLRICESHGDIITSVMSVIQSTTISSVLLYVMPNTTVDFLNQAKELHMLHSHYDWLVTCRDEEESRTIGAILCCKPSNMALVIPVITSSLNNITNNVSQSMFSCSNDNCTMNSSKRHESYRPTRRPSKFSVYSYPVTATMFDLVASWTPRSRLKVSVDAIFPGVFQQFNNATLRVGAWEAEPFTKRMPSNGTLAYDGFCFTILNEMARHLNFTYEVIEPDDGQYGAPDENGTWNGMVGMLIRGELDLAVGPFSITPERKLVVDFTVPYMEDGGGILTKGGDPEPDFLSVFRPFPLAVWLMIASAVVIAACILFAITKVNEFMIFYPKDLQQQQQPQQEQNQRLPWTLEECFIVIYGSLMNQGACRHPDMSAGRLVLGFWWMFTILIVSIYTASLAALLTVRVESDHINSIQELAASSLDPVTLKGSSWWTLFMNAKSGVYHEIGERMANSPVVRVNKDALKLVHDGTAAYVIDINQIQFLRDQDCKRLHMAKNVFNSNGLGFVMPKNAYYSDAISSMVLKLQEGGFLETWKQQWWHTTPECNSNAPSVNNAKQLQVVSIGGILIVYLVVIVMAILCHLLQCVMWLPCCSRLRQLVEVMCGNGQDEDKPSQ